MLSTPSMLSSPKAPLPVLRRSPLWKTSNGYSLSGIKAMDSCSAGCLSMRIPCTSCSQKPAERALKVSFYFGWFLPESNNHYVFAQFCPSACFGNLCKWFHVDCRIGCCDRCTHSPNITLLKPRLLWSLPNPTLQWPYLFLKSRQCWKCMYVLLQDAYANRNQCKRPSKYV